MAKRTKDKMRRLVSMTLALAMTLSMFSTGFSGVAQAAQEPLPSADDAAEATTGVIKPTLYIDFLGDDSTLFTSQGITAPSDRDLSLAQNQGTGNDGNFWDRYSKNTELETIFWVGVGIDKMSLFELAKDGKGLSSLELGFYYNAEFVKPYAGSYTDKGSITSRNKEYKSQITAKNFADGSSSTFNSVNQWDSRYYNPDQVQALTELEPVSDPDTREMEVPEGWKMLYVSLEKVAGQEDNVETNRFADMTADCSETQYILMLPFQLKKIDPNQNICFRLSRDASLFSIGGGTYGAGVYSDSNDPSGFGAWEKTTRTPNHNLKEMFDFEGDLNIFKGINERDELYTATLAKDATADDSRGNTVTLSDSYRTVTTVGAAVGSMDRKLDNLPGGVIMTLHIEKASDVDSISIEVEPSKSTTPVPTVEKVPGSDTDYTFPMPSDDVTVRVRFNTDADKDTYDAKLIVDNSSGAAGNTAEMEAWDRTDDTAIPGKSTDMAGGVDTIKDITATEPVKVHVKAHPDYEARISVKKLSGGTTLESKDITVDPVETGDDTWAWDFTFDMPMSDVEVTVSYTLRENHHAELSVISDKPYSSKNEATLWYNNYSGDQSTVAGVREEVTLNGGNSGGLAILGGNPSRIPEGREVTLDIVSDTDYAASQVWWINLDDPSQVWKDLQPDLKDNGTTDEGLKKQTYSFPMPEYNVQVRVIFSKAGDYNLTLVLEDDGQSANRADLSGKDTAGVLQSTDMRATPVVDKIKVRSGEDITLGNISYAPGYVISLVEYYDEDDNLLSSVTGSGITAGVLRKMPYYDLKVVLHFSNENFRAVMVPSDTNGYVSLGDGGQTGWWKNGAGSFDSVDNGAKELFEGRVTVREGWYIASITVIGDDTGDAYSIESSSGNGYNNGKGAGINGFDPVSIWLTQPSENIHVYIELVEGVPPEEPEKSLTLRVKDPDKKDENWAQIQAVDETPVSGAVVRDEGSDILSPVVTWQRVKVHVNIADGYKAEVKALPDIYGVEPDWEDKNTFWICQPAGPIQVTVTYSPIGEDDERNHTATLYINNASLGGAELTNRTTSQSVNKNGESVPIRTGDELTTAVWPLSPNYTVIVELATGGKLTKLDDPYDFTALPDDAEVYVTFVKDGEIGDIEHKRTLILTAYGPGDVGAAGSAALTAGVITSGSASTPSNGRPVTALVDPDGSVQVDITPNTDYELDYVTLIRNGVASTQWPSGNTLTFPMPDEDVEVQVHFREESAKPRQYTADIVLRPPTGVPASAVGSAEFIRNGQYSIAASAGEKLDILTNIANGYRISRVEITPKALGITNNRTGDFGIQTIDFIMKNADCTVNIYLEEGYPDGESKANLKVIDADYDSGEPANNNAELWDTTAPRDTRTTGPVYGDGVEKGIKAMTGDRLEVQLNPTDPKYTAEISITNAVTGQEISNSQWGNTSSGVWINMPPNDVNIVVTFREKGPEDAHKATLIYTDKDSDPSADAHGVATISNTVAGSTSDHREEIRPLYVRDTVTVTLKPEEGYVAAVSVLSGGIRPINHDKPVKKNEDGTFTTSFVMDDEDAEVFVTFRKELPEDEDWITFEVTQTGSNPPSYGSAELTNTRGGATGLVDSVGIKTEVSGQPGEVLTITAKPADNRGVSYVELVDVNGNRTIRTMPDSITGTGAYTYTYTLTMPTEPNKGPVQVRVVFGDAKKDLEARLVVNDGGGSGNTAKFSKASGGLWRADNWITGLSSPADQVFLEITTMPYYVAEIKVYAADSPMQGEAVNGTSFYMPGSDVLVYVNFVPDPRTRYNITMSVSHAEGLTPDPDNMASLTTNLNGIQGPVGDGRTLTAESFAEDPVLVTIQRDRTKYWVEVIAKLPDGSDVSDLTVDTDDDNLYSFFMPSSDVSVEVIFHSVDEPIDGQEVWFHLVGDPTGAMSATDDTFVAEDADRANKTYLDNTYIEVKPNEPVYVSAKAEENYYIKNAYAMYGNTMLPLNLNSDGYDGDGNLVQKDGTFRMQNGRVDVYIEMGNKADKPDQLHYTAALTVEGPEGEPVGAAGHAVLKHTESDPSVDPDTVKPIRVDSNKEFDPATDVFPVLPGDTLTATVTVKYGYKISKVVVTPLGLSVTPTSKYTDTVTGDTVYTYKMPAANVAVNVILMRDPDVDFHEVTLELKDADPSTPSANSAKVSYDVYEATKDGDHFPVPETQTVTIEVEVGVGYYVKHAYAVSKGNPQRLTILDPTGWTGDTLQNLGYEATNVVTGKATFVMPDDDVIVHIEFADEVEDPPVGNLTAVLTVFDPGNTGSSTVTMSREQDHTPKSVSAISDGKTSGPISVYGLSHEKGPEKVTLTLDIADGYELESIEVLGGPEGAPPVEVKEGDNKNEYVFTMPDYTVGVVVRLRESEAEDYKATLHIVDTSSALGNVVTMSCQEDPTKTTNEDGKFIAGLMGGEHIETVVQPEDNKVQITAVLAKVDGGDPQLLTPSALNTYLYTMTAADVDIYVILGDYYVATVVKDDPYEDPGNDIVSIGNLTNPALPSVPDLWTLAEEKDKIRVVATIAPEFEAWCEANILNDDGTKTAISEDKIYYSCDKSSGIITIELMDGMPPANVEITIHYGTVLPPMPFSRLTLVVEGHDDLPDNWAQAVSEDETITLTANNVAATPYTDETEVAPRTKFKLTTNTDTDYYIESIVVTVNGYEISKTQANPTDFTVPHYPESSKVVVTVTLAKGPRTARPYNGKQDPSSATDHPDFIDGYLIAQNKGSNRVEITVPNLYETATKTVLDAKGVEYKLYVKAGSTYTLLEEGVDYNRVSGPTDYPNGTTGTGQRFTISNIKPVSALGEYFRNGGVIYITATDSDTPKPESEFVEVLIGEDPLKGDYTAWLHIVDSSGVLGNTAQMQDASTGRTVSNDWDYIDKLNGGELIRTEANHMPNVAVSVVAHVNSTSDTLLDENPEGTNRYPKDMPSEDMIITVHFSPDGSDPDYPRIYIAAVEETGAVDVPDNYATIKNEDRPDLRNGAQDDSGLWTEAYEDNVVKVTINTDPNYRAKVTLVNKETGEEVMEVTDGLGNGIPFDVSFEMPDADVQVEVFYYYKEPDKDPEYQKLTLTTVDTDGAEDTLTGNGATLEVADAAGTTSIGSNTITGYDSTVRVPDDDTQAPVGGKLELDATLDANYRVKKIVHTVYDTDGVTPRFTPLTYGPITAPVTSGDPWWSAKVLQGGANDVAVYFQKGPWMPRPYNPDHVPVTDDDKPATQEGYLLAETLENDANGHYRIQITVPTLHDDVEDKLSDADSSVADYKLYWKNGLGQYVELETTGINKSITVSDGADVDPSYTDSSDVPYKGYQFTVTADSLGSQISYYMKNGGVIYITATDKVKNPDDLGESDYTEVVILPAYSATLHSAPGSATMEANTTPPRSVNKDGDTITGLNPGKIVTVKDITAPKELKVVDVVVNGRESGNTVRATEVTPGEEYTYTMKDEDVDVTIAYNDKPWDMYIVTVSKVYDDGLPGNYATVVNKTVTMPSYSKGDVWTGAYTGNQVQVDAYTERDYYVVDYIVETDGESVTVRKATDHLIIEGVKNADIDVTVVYSKEPPEAVELKLQTKDTGGIAGNQATLTATGTTASVTINGVDRTDSAGKVTPGTPLELTTGTAAGYVVSRVQIESGGVSGDVLITDGAYTLPNMYLEDTTVIVTYEKGTQTGRPYDPEHSERYNSADYAHYGPDDLSQTHMDGWIEATPTGANSFNILVPTLYHDNTLENAAEPESAYRLYWRDAANAFQEFTVGTDIKVTGVGVVPGAYDTYNGYELQVEILVDDESGYPTLWNGYTLQEYLTNGGSIYITATGDSDDAKESEKTEVVIPKTEKTYRATMVMQNGEDVGYDGTATGWQPGLIFPTVFNPAKATVSGQVRVERDWSIVSLWAESVDGTRGFPVRYSGNGYNNGRGGIVTVELEQPEEDVLVYIVLDKGIPPAYGLTLSVEDADANDDNWAKISQVDGDPVSRDTVTASGTAPTVNKDIITSLTMNQKVVVEVHPADGYAVEDVLITPIGLDIAPVWLDSTHFEITQPAGHPIVTVKFAQKDERNNKVTLYINEVGGAAGTAVVTNTATGSNINTNGSSTAIRTGDALEVHVQPDPSVYAKVTVMNGGGKDTWITANAGDLIAQVIDALPGDVDVFVEFSDGPFSNLIVKAFGPAGSGAVDVTAEGTPIESLTAVPAGDVVSATVTPDGQVEVTIRPNDGYTVNVTTSDPSVTLSNSTDGSGNRVISFLMPDDDPFVVVVEFTEGPAPIRTANVVSLLTDRTPTNPNTQGDSQFVDGGTRLGYSVVSQIGEHWEIRAEAKNGYRIKEIRADAGITLSKSGTMVTKSIQFDMPNADNVTITVIYEKAWPNMGEAILNVYDKASPKDNYAKLIDTVTRAQTDDVYDGGSDFIATEDRNQLRVDVYGIDKDTKATAVITDSDGRQLTEGIDYRWETTLAGEKYILVDMQAPNLQIDVTFAPLDPDVDKLKATLYYDESEGGSVSIQSGTLAPVTGNGEILEPLYATDLVNVTITPPSGKVPVLEVTGDGDTNARYEYTPEPMTESGGTYTTTFTMQNEDVTVKVRFIDEPQPNERIVTLTVQGPTGSGDASMRDSDGNSTSPDPVSVGSSGIMTAELGKTMTITTNPADGYTEAKPIGVVINGGLIPVNQEGPNTYTFVIPTDLPEGKEVVAVVTYEKTREDLRVDLVKKDPTGAAGNVASLISGKGTADKWEDPDQTVVTGIAGLAAKDLVTVDVKVASDYEAEVFIQGRGKVAKFTASGTYDFYMPNGDTVVTVEYVKKVDIRYNITLDVEPESSDDSYNEENKAEIRTDFSGTAGPINGDDTPVTVKGEVNDVVSIRVDPQDGYYTRVTYQSDTDSQVRNLTSDPDDDTLYTFSVPNANVKVEVQFILEEDDPKPEHTVTLHLLDAAGNYIDPATSALYSGLLSELKKNTVVWDTETADLEQKTIQVPMDAVVEVHANATQQSGSYIDYVKSAYASYGGTLLDPITPNGYVDVTTAVDTKTVRVQRDFTFKMQDGDVDVYIILDVIDKASDEPEFTAALTVEDEDDPGASTGEAGRAGYAVLSRTEASESVTIGSNELTLVPTTSNTVGMKPGETLNVTVTANPGYALDRIVITDLALELKADKVSETAQSDGSVVYVYTVEVPENIDRDLAVNVFLLRLRVGRPYDPYHSETYNSPDYAHYGPKDDSTTHQEGWLLAERPSDLSLPSGQVQVTVPTLWEFSPELDGYHLVDANAHEFKLYYYDETDTTGDPYRELVLGTDYTLSEFDHDEYYTGSGLWGSQFILGEVQGGWLENKLDAGLSLFITAQREQPDDPEWKESGKTELVIPELNKKLQPYDPDNVNDQTDPTPYEDYWITSENRGDYLIVTVPLLNKKGATDNSAAEDVDKAKHTFQFYLVDDFTDDSDPDNWTYQALADVITLTHPDPDNNPNNDPYENDSYYTDTTISRDFYGARFILTVKTEEEIDQWVDDEVKAGNIATTDEAQAKADYKALAEKLRLIIDNEGTENTISGLDLDEDGMAETHYRLYITHTEDNGNNPVYTSPYVDFEVPRYYALVGQLESYAPRHIATFTLTDGTEEYVSRMKSDAGVGMWRQDFKIKLTSDLDKLNAGQDFTMTIEKAGHVTYTRTQIVLDDAAALTDGQFDPDTLEFNFTDIIRLFAGDVDGNGVVRAQDVDMLYIVLYGPYIWTREPDDKNDPSAWDRSVYNPESAAYAADLNGDGKVTSQDLDIIYEPENYGHRVRDYGSPTGLGPAVTIALFSVRYQWANDILLAGKTLPTWVMDLILEEGALPSWAIRMVQEEKDMPAWCVELVAKEMDLPTWASDMLLAEKTIPAWAQKLLREEKPLPQWAVELVKGEETVPGWATELLLAEKTLPAWAIDLARAGEELPQDMAQLIEAGEDLPEELPEPPMAPVEPALPVMPDAPTNDAHSNSKDTEIYIPETEEQVGTASGSQGEGSNNNPEDEVPDIGTVLPDDPAEESGSRAEPSGEEPDAPTPDPALDTAPDFDTDTDHTSDSDFDRVGTVLPDSPAEESDNKEGHPSEVKGPASNAKDGMDQAGVTEAQATKSVEPTEAEVCPSTPAPTLEDLISA